MKIIQFPYFIAVMVFAGCREDKKTPLISLSADEAHQKGLDFYASAEDTVYNIRQQFADSAIYYFKYELKLRQAQFGENHWRVHKAQLNIGVIYQHDFANLVLAQQSYETALFDPKTDTTGMNVIAPFLEAEILYNIGVATERLGDYELARSYALRSDSLFIALKVLNKADNFNDFQNYLNNLSNLGDIYAAMKSPRAIEFFNRILELGSKQEIPVDIRLQAVLNRGIAYRLVNQWVAAESDLLQARNLCAAREDSANVRIELAKLYLDKKQFPIAENYALQSLKLRSDYPKGHPILAEVYTVLGQIYLKINQLERAKKAFQDALGDLNNHNIPQSAIHNPKSYHSTWQIEALTQLADLEAPSDMEKAAATYQKLSDRLYERKSFFKTDAAKLNLTQQARHIFERAISLNSQLFKKTQKLHFLDRVLSDMERSKSVLLSEAIQDSRIKSYYDVPDSVRQRERTLKLAVAQAEYKFNSDEIAFQTNATFLSEKYKEWQNFVQYLQQKYPKYYRHKHEKPQLLAVQTVQQQLPDNTLLVHYYLANHILHILCINSSIAQSYEIPLTAQFDTVFNQYQRLLAQKDWDWQMNPLFSQASYQLYHYLLEKPLQDFKTKNLILIPDGKLANLSFAALFTKAHLLNDKHEEPYLIHQYSVHMAYTLHDCGMRISDFGMQIPKSQIPNPKSKYFYAGFSHDFNLVASSNWGKKDLGKLMGSKAHIEQMNHLFKAKGQNFINTRMTLEAFKTVLPQSKFVELISHAGFDPQDFRKAAIAFPNAQNTNIDLLEMQDIYNLNCANNQLLTLIACETGKGLPLQGETVISMAYAFAYSGVRRRISAFWSIPSEQSTELMNLFFNHLLKEKLPAVALQKAQIKFLQPETRPATNQTPNLWAGLVLSGNITAITE